MLYPVAGLDAYLTPGFFSGCGTLLAVMLARWLVIKFWCVSWGLSVVDRIRLTKSVRAWSGIAMDMTGPFVAWSLGGGLDLILFRRHVGSTEATQSKAGAGAR